jgi:hypothetical protein
MWHRLLTHRWCLPLLAALGMLLASPTLRDGMLGDDFIHLSFMLSPAGPVQSGSFYGLFSFIDGNPEHIQALKAKGQLTWWASEHGHLAFWRPLTELTHGLDYLLWPQSPALMHLQSLLWYGLLILLLGKLYRAFMPSLLEANLATLLFAISSLHAFVIAWLAARNQLVAGCFTVLTITSFHLWRSGAGRRHGWLAAAALALGLLSAEGALATMGYLVAYAVTLDTAPWRKRLAALAPLVAMVLMWRLIYEALGYGCAGSGGYIDPGSEPLRFAQALMLRLPAMLLAQLYGVSTALFITLNHPAQMVLALVATVAIALTGLAGHYFKLWSTPLARFWALGALLALVPVCAAQANDRLLLTAEIGLNGLLAMWLTTVGTHRRLFHGWRSWAPKGVTLLLVAVHLMVYPLALVTWSIVIKGMSVGTLQDEPLALTDAGDNPSTRVIVLNAPNPMLAYYYPYMRSHFGLSNPASLHVLAGGANEELSLRVLDEHTIELSTRKGFMDWMSRDVDTEPFRVGDQVHLGHLNITVLAVSANGTPQTALFRFERPLDDATWQFYAWQGNGFARYKLPDRGVSVTLPAIPMGPLMMRRFKSSLN